MKIIIEHNRVKRTIEGSGFNICGSPADLLRIAKEIQRQVEATTGYGWISVRDAITDEHCAGANTSPIPWDK